MNLYIRLLFNGGVTLDGLLPITPDRLDLVQVLDAAGNSIPSIPKPLFKQATKFIPRNWWQLWHLSMK